MRPALAVAVGASFLYVVYQVFMGDVASVQLIAAYTLASILAGWLTWIEPRWTATLKWSWVALSAVVAYGVISGPLDYLRLNSVG